MVCVVGVRFKLAGKVYYFDPADLAISPGSKVVVETVRGVEYGEVVVGPRDVDDDEVVQPLKRVIRVGSERDAEVAAENKRKEKDAFGIALQKIEGHHLEMYLVDVEYTFDGSKIIFYFTAEGRVDFRELVRDLASVFRTRIEMRQIGVRDEAKLLGGIGPCGRVLCCTSFLGDFAPVSIRMAKDQNLSLNPSKISGLCGRLMCCLRYEQETYEAAKKDPTLAPSYVPPQPEAPAPDFDEWDVERPAPVIGVRGRSESDLSARIAQVAAPERSASRRERPRSKAGSPGGEREGRQRAGQDRAPREAGPGARQDGPASKPQQERPKQPKTVAASEGRNQGQPDGSREGRLGVPVPTAQAGGGERPSKRRRRRRSPRPSSGDSSANPPKSSS